jgi:hypothetical protein
MPTKPTDRSETLDRTPVSVGERVVTAVGGGVIPGGSCIPVEVEVELLTPGGSVFEPAPGSPLLVDPVPEMYSDDVVSVALIDELTELLAMAEEEMSSRLILDEGTGVTVEIRLGERVKIVLVLATGNGKFVSDADTTLVLDVSVKVVVSLSSCTEDDAPSNSTLLLLSGIAIAIETSAGGMIFSVPLVSCAEPGKERKSVRTIVEQTKGDIIMLTCLDEC